MEQQCIDVCRAKGGDIACLNLYAGLLDPEYVERWGWICKCLNGNNKAVSPSSITSWQCWVNEIGESTCATVRLHNYAWPGFNGNWYRWPGLEKNGAPVYCGIIVDAEGRWKFWYMWLDSGFGAWGWAIGLDYNKRSWWGWKWGKHVLEDSVSKRLGDESGTWWYRTTDGNWHHDGDAYMTCPGGFTDADAAELPSPGTGADGAVPPETDGVGMDSVPPFTDDASSGATSSNDVVPMVLGAAMGAVAIAALVTVVVVMRKKKIAATESVTEMKAVHVPDESVATKTNTEMEKESEKEVVTEPEPNVVDAVAAE